MFSWRRRSKCNWLARCTLLTVIMLAGARASAQEAVLRCRLDPTLAPIVQTAAQWGLGTLAASGDPLRFKRVAINPLGPVPSDTLSIFLIKDAGIKAVDRAGCIPLDRKVPLSGGVVALDGACMAGQRKRCTAAEEAYMARRLLELASAMVDDSRTGYEMTGACYMTNLHACLERDKHALLKAVGPRDPLSVKGTCVTNHQAATIRCSAGALKLLLTTESVRKEVPSVALLQVIGHELGHILARQSSQYNGDDHTLDLQAPGEQKTAHISRLCMTGDSLRKSERDADETGLRISRQWLPEIHRRLSSGGTIPWLVTQSIHFATNLARWNNAWITAVKVEDARVFARNQSNQIREFDLETGTLSGLGAGLNNPRLAARQFICGLRWARSGHLALDFQSGTLHGTLAERLGPVLTSLRKVEREANSAVSDLEHLVGTMADKVFHVEQAHMNRLEGEICSIIDQSDSCTDPAVLEPAVFSSTPADVNGLKELRLPLRFEMQGPYRDTPESARALVLNASSYGVSDSEEAALEEAKSFVKAYSALLGQIDGAMKRSGGFWIVPPAADVKVNFNSFSGGYMAHIAMHVIARMGGQFSEADMQALQEIRTWGTGVYVDLDDWDKARYGINAYFRPVAPAAPSPEVGVATIEMTLDQLFDLEETRRALRPSPSKLVNQLLPFLRARVERKFGGQYSMLGDAPPTFFIRLPHDNLSLPASWAAAATSKPDGPGDATLSSLLQLAFIRGGPRLDVQAVFKERK